MSLPPGSAGRGAHAAADDLGVPVPLPGPPRRVVSLVPSLTETVAVTAPGILVGATDWCTHPPELDVARVGGTKYPDVDAVLRLRPDLVVANAEENRPEDVAALRAAGVPVWVTYPRTLDEAIGSLRRMLAVLGPAGVPDPAGGGTGWLDAAARAWAAPPAGPALRAVVPVWRRPWVVLGADTFAADLLRRLGVTVLDGAGAGGMLRQDTGAGPRYPRPSLEEMRAWHPDVVVLPDEPYPFTAGDGPEAFAPLPYVLLSGRHLTWYGPSLVQARERLAADLRGVVRP